ncbi:MAG: RNA 3'-terminal phosphate cyclase [Elusimicrobia bacterium]|nr:RNA 3'-terminal phosphate cyclase [Elusimicrobiota bacterium]
MIEIDGSHGEGGGQILRTAVVLSLATGQGFRLRSIRAGRPQPGLKAQHLHILKALGRFCGCEVTSAALGSSEVSFSPGPVAGAKVVVDVGTAGSVTMMLQSLLPAAFLAKGACEFSLTGGTDVRWSMPVDYLRSVLLQHLPGVTLSLERRGFHPRGGGRVSVTVTPRPLPRLSLVGPPSIERLHVFSSASRHLQAAQVAERQAAAASRIIRNLGREIVETVTYDDSLSPGSVITIAAEAGTGAAIGADSLGELGKRAEEVGREAAELFNEEILSGVSVDRHAGDNLVLWLALRGGAVEVSEVTEHTRTNIWVCEQFLGRVFRMEGRTISVESPVS